MIIDVHCHPWSFKSVGYYKRLPLFRYMEDLGIDRVVMLGMNNAENKTIVKLVKKYPDKISGFAYVNPKTLSKTLKHFEEGVKAGYFRGVKMYPYFEHFQLDDKVLYPFYERCLSLDIPLLFHTGWVMMHEDASSGHAGRYACTGFPVQFGNVLEDFPKLKLIFSHMGGNFYYECLTLSERFENVYLETAWLRYYTQRFLPKIKVKEWIEHASQILGSKKIIYGGEGIYPDDVKHTNLSEEQKVDILGNNATRLLKL